MTDPDIVTQLRGHIAITTRLHYAKDGYPEPVYVHGPSPICQEAADEIERLRNDLDGSQLAYRGASYDRDRMRAERDEARRECCRHMAHGVMSAEDYAKYLNWDCFKENEK